MFVFLLQPVPLSLFFGAGGKNCVQNKTFQKIHNERHYALPRGLRIFSIEETSVSLFFWGGGCQDVEVSVPPPPTP